MECKDCKYKYTVEYSNYKESVCNITHRIINDKCSCNHTEDEAENDKICYNCKNFIGGGDWGLSCERFYYMTNTDGFRPACDEFERK